MHSFKFGFGKTKKFENPIDILRNEDKTVRNQGNYRSNENILDWLKHFWKPSLHFERGICYTFDGMAITLNQTDNGIIATKAKETMSKAMYKGALLKFEMNFDVSLNTLFTIHH